MTTSAASPRPFQFGLRSLFLATAAIAVAFGVLNWFGAEALILAVQFSAVIAVLVKSKGTAWREMVFSGSLVALLLLTPAGFDILILPIVAFFASLVAWFVGGLTASEMTRKQSRFLRWSWLLALLWFVFVWIFILPFVFIYF
jgi:hypothetical protein